MSAIMGRNPSYLNSVKTAFVEVLLPMPLETFKVIGPLVGVILIVVSAGSALILLAALGIVAVVLVHLAYFVAGLAGFAKPVSNNKTKDV